MYTEEPINSKVDVVSSELPICLVLRRAGCGVAPIGGRAQAYRQPLCSLINVSDIRWHLSGERSGFLLLSVAVCWYFLLSVSVPLDDCVNACAVVPMT